jgi:RNA polymerase sigma-70 factor (ECF subfamily)
LLIENKHQLARRIQISEESLVALVASGSQEGFRILYDNFSAALYGVIERIVTDQGQAEDVLQDAFLKIWKSFPAYSPVKGRLFTWMMNICRNLAIDHVRSRQHKVSQNIQSLESFVGTEKGSIRMEHLDFIGIETALNKLKPEQLHLIQLAYFQGYTQEEIAEEAGIPLGTVKTRIRSALQILRDELRN